jgi:hypothetical protein
LLAHRAGGDRVVAGHHDRADAHRAKLLDPFRDPGFHDVGQRDDPQDLAPVGDRERCRALARDAFGDVLEIRGHRRAERLGDVAGDCVHGALAQAAAVGQVDPAHPRARRELEELRAVELRLGLGPSAEPLREAAHGPPLRGLVERGSQVCRLHERPRVAPGERDELRCLPVAQRDRPGLVEDQRLHVAGGLDGFPRHRQHVEAHRPVDPGDPDRREQRADRRRDQRDEERDRVGDVDARVKVGRNRGHRGDDDHED